MQVGRSKADHEEWKEKSVSGSGCNDYPGPWIDQLVSRVLYWREPAMTIYLG